MKRTQLEQTKQNKQPKQSLQELNLLNRFLFVEASEDEEVAEASGSGRIRALHKKVESIRRNEEIEVRFVNEREEKLLERQAGFEEGEASGFEKGEASGFEKGEASGLEKGELKRSLEIAANMLKRNMCKTDIAEMTGLSMEKIETIRI